jgi:hypothetical protein
MRDPQLRERFGKAGRKRAEENFSWAAIAAKTKALYETLKGEALVRIGSVPLQQFNAFNNVTREAMLSIGSKLCTSGKGRARVRQFSSREICAERWPDGGDGGRGGDVILRADRHVDNLANLFYEPILRQRTAGTGWEKKWRTRRRDQDREGSSCTIVYAVEGAQRSTFNAQTFNAQCRRIGIPIVDLTRDGQEFVLCRGGTGVKAMCISRARATAHRGNTRRVKKASREISFSSYERLRTRTRWLSECRQIDAVAENLRCATEGCDISVHDAASDRWRNGNARLPAGEHCGYPGLIEGAHRGSDWATNSCATSRAAAFWCS